jgi:hypothetical protein
MEQDEKWQIGRKYLDMTLYYQEQGETTNKDVTA